MFLFARMHDDIHSIMERDPAARTRLEVLLCYPGLWAVWIYRLSHWLWRHKLRLPARVLSQISRFYTGVDIHPAALIGQRLFIDHAMGVVIGETAIVGSDVTMYQGVTLGGTGKGHGKRHPTVCDGVFIGNNANILGNVTVGENSRVGAGSVVLSDVPPNSTVVGVPAHIVYHDGQRVLITDPHEIHSYGEGLWWAIQTVTTVGYGDVVPQSVLGRLMAALIMITGIAFLTVTTAAVTNIFIERARQRRDGGRDVHREIAALSAQITELADEVRALRKSDTTP